MDCCRSTPPNWHSGRGTSANIAHIISLMIITLYWLEGVGSPIPTQNPKKYSDLTFEAVRLAKLENSLMAFPHTQLLKSMRLFLLLEGTKI
jgi:hypothetical protein